MIAQNDVKKNRQIMVLGLPERCGAVNGRREAVNKIGAKIIPDNLR